MGRTPYCLGCALALTIALQACNKNSANLSSSSSADSSGTTSTSTAIAVAVDSGGTDSVYIMQSCAGGYYRDSIAPAELPITVSSYLDSTYTGFSYVKSFVVKASGGATAGYVVIIRYNGLPVGLLFDANGALIRVLEQRERDDLHGDGWHHGGGRYGNRDGRGRDTIAIGSLPSAVTAYFSSTYPGDTLARAFVNIDSSYLVISRNNGLFATLFSATGSFVRRVQLQRWTNTVSAIDASALPAAAVTYLSVTYPGYVFGKAFAYSVNGTVNGYVVVIDASNTKYAVEFDASGNETGAIAIW